MTAPQISVCMTAFNREPYIAEAIESVLNSHFKDIELIVVDDQSSDSTLSIAKRYEQTDSRVRVYQNPKNLGDYPNRNRAVSYATGKYIKFVDSDDVIYPYSLDFMYSAMEAHPNAAFALGRPKLYDRPFPCEIVPLDAYREHFFGNGLLDCGPGGTILHRERFLANGGFEELRYSGDTKTWLKLSAKYPVLLLPRDLIWWRQHPGQEFIKGTREYSYLELNYCVARDALESPNCPLPRPEVEKALKALKRAHGRSLIRLALRGKPAQSYRVGKNCNFGLSDLRLAFC